jgi:hypothetical protein
LYVIVAVVVLGAGAGAWTYLGGGGEGVMEEGEMMEEGSVEGSRSLRALLSLTTPQRCTFEEVSEGSTSSGTVYIANGQMRGDFTSTSGGQSMESHMIVKGSESYVWSSAFAGGFKTSLDAMSSSDKQNGVDPDKPVNFSCSSWVANASMFALPTDIEFQDISASVEAAAGAGANVQGMQCSACAQISDPVGQAQCRQALGC